MMLAAQHPVVRRDAGRAVRHRQRHHAAAGRGQSLRGRDRPAGDRRRRGSTWCRRSTRLGTMLAPLFGGYLILGRSKGGTAEAGTVLTAAERLADAQSVHLPYVMVAVVLVVLAVVIARYPLPAMGAATRRAAKRGAQAPFAVAAPQPRVRRAGDLHLPDRRDRRRQPVHQLRLASRTSATSPTSRPGATSSCCGAG